MPFPLGLYCREITAPRHTVIARRGAMHSVARLSFLHLYDVAARVYMLKLW